MSNLKNYLILITSFFAINVLAQPGFDYNSYNDFRESTTGLSASQLSDMYSMDKQEYFKGFDGLYDFNQVHYLDSVIKKFELTQDEISLLKQNLFFVTERLNQHSFGCAFHSVYSKDLPVFISTDAVLHALHKSYDEVLKTVEMEIMSTNLEIFLESIYNGFQELAVKYQGNPQLEQPLKDVGLYVTMAYSLIKEELQEPLYVKEEILKEVWDAVKGEQLTKLSMFSEHKREWDFSQFKVRGHYVHTAEGKVNGLKSLEPYFRAMMWLGRIDFFLTPPADNPWENPWAEEDILRLNLTSFMLNELINSSEKSELLNQNEKIINYLIGQPDNITPAEYQLAIDNLNINSAVQLLNTDNYNALQEELTSNPDFSQRILSCFLFSNPSSNNPDELPVSFRVSGQRFIIDSYIFSNVVYDRIVYNGEKIWRAMPHVFDALFALGNNAVLQLLLDELIAYPYAVQLAIMRYLTDIEPDEFWSESLYNVWLNSIRELNPSEITEEMPLFMQSAAWQHQKMNTQLASWAQLRHDNLLYAKQSYTEATGCSFPYSYVEPYPDFYKNIQQFASDAANFFEELSVGNYWMTTVTSFFRNFAEVCGKLETIAEKELAGKSFEPEEKEWLQSMLFTGGKSGEPPYTGWYPNLFYDAWHASESDYTIVDVHTQPTNEAGSIVGKVLHIATGDVNLGVFIANCPATQKPMAFVGPAMSYYQTITDNFKRMTDQEWENMILENTIPERPDWTNIYLAGKEGEARAQGPELPSKAYTNNSVVIPGNETVDILVYPNPFNNKVNVQFNINKKSSLSFKLYNSLGSLVSQTTETDFLPGLNQVEIPGSILTPGFYILKAKVDGANYQSWKILKK